jgi:DNA replication protein DnaC
MDGWIPPRFAECTLENYVPSTESQRSALAAARDVVAGALRNLVLVGPVGLGKTHLAAAVVGAIHARGMDAWREASGAAASPVPALPPRPMWGNVAELMNDMRLEIGRPPDDRNAASLALALGRSRGYVVLDDLGREKITDWTTEVIYVLGNRRYEALLPTIVTTNKTPVELVDNGYWPIVSRLAQDGRLIELDGYDYRLRAPDE